MLRNWLLGCGASFSVLAACAAVPSPKVPGSLASPPAALGGDAPEIHRYCGDRIESIDGYRCVEEVTAEQQRHRHQTWDFAYRAGRLVRIDQINGRGMKIDSESGCASWEPQWAGGELTGAICRDHNGLVQSLASYQARGSWMSWRDFRGRPLALLGRHAVASRRAFDADGLLRASWALDAAGAPTQPGRDGVTEVWRRRNADGVLIERTHFNGDGKPTRDRAGIHRYLFEVDPSGRLLARRAFDDQGKPAVDHNHVHLFRYAHDDFGNVIRTETFDVADRPVRATSDGAAALVIVRDDHGAEIERRLLDETGRLIAGGEGWAIRRTTVDRHGLSADVTFFGVNDTPVRLITGTFRMKIARDDAGNVTSEETFDIDGRPVEGLDGTARRVFSYDARMHPTRIAYSAGDGAPAFSRGGYAAVEQTFDGDRLVQKRFVDVERHPINSWEGYCLVTIIYGLDGAEAFREKVISWPQLPVNGWRGTNDLPQLQVRPPKAAGEVKIPTSPTLVDEALASSERVGASRLLAAALSAYGLRRIEDAAFLLMAGSLRAIADLSRFLPKGRGHDSPAAFYNALVGAAAGAIMAAIDLHPEALGRVVERLRHFQLQSEASYRPEWEVEAEIPGSRWRRTFDLVRLTKIHGLEGKLQRATNPGFLRCLRVFDQKKGNAAARISEERFNRAVEALARYGRGAGFGAGADREAQEDRCDDQDLDRDWLPSLFVQDGGLVRTTETSLDVDNP